MLVDEGDRVLQRETLEYRARSEAPSDLVYAEGIEIALSSCLSATFVLCDGAWVDRPLLQADRAVLAGTR